MIGKTIPGEAERRARGGGCAVGKQHRARVMDVPSPGRRDVGSEG